jgi:arabinose-5-phosphate isomerase
LKSSEKIQETALNLIQDEANAISGLVKYINPEFADCVKLILECKGKVVMTGIGKSAIIAAKIVATLNSTGTPAVFMHAADAIHGDLGSIQKDDIIICLSKSGDTPEIKVLVPILKMMGNKMIALVGNTGSYLASHADHVINSYVEKEACPNNLAPTSSTTAQLVMGDALAVCLLECRGFTTADFAKYHPGGALGKKLYLRVSDIYPNNEKPKVKPGDHINDVILEISSKRLGSTAVLEGDKLIGVITDGDLRRMLQSKRDMADLTARDIMSRNPKTVEKDTLLIDALTTMRSNNITQLLVVDKGRYLGMIHLHDILMEGIL